MDDESVRWCILIAAGIVAVAAALGGYLSPVSGRWRDGEHVIELRQRMMRLRGQARVSNGMQLFVGWVVFGRVRLWRYNFGARHLMALGFTAAQAKELEGARTGLFELRIKDAATLEGSFCGTRFTFDDAKGARDAGLSEPAPRCWVREGVDAAREPATGLPD